MKSHVMGDDLSERAPVFRATTVMSVRHGGTVAIAGDGQVSIGQTVVKSAARKVRKLHHGRVVAGFAGAAADAFTLFARFEAKLEEYRGNLPRAAVELAKDWRTDRVLRRLEALLVGGRRGGVLHRLRHRRRHRAGRRLDRNRLAAGPSRWRRRARWWPTPAWTRRPSRSRRSASRRTSACTPTITSRWRPCRERAHPAPRSSPSWTATSWASIAPSGRWPSRSATAGGARTSRPSCATRWRRRTSS